MRSKVNTYRDAHRNDTFALIIASRGGGPDDAYVIPFGRLAPIFARTRPNGKNAGTWLAHVVHGRFYFAQPDEVNIADCHGTQPQVRKIVEATLVGDEPAILRVLTELSVSK